MGAPPTQQQQQPSANSASHLFGSQGTAPFLTQQQQQASVPSGNQSYYSQQQPPASYSQQQQSDSTSYQIPSAYGSQAGYSAASNVAPPPSVTSYPQQQYQATPTGATYPQGYATSRYPTATPPQPAPVSSQAYSMYGANKNVTGYGQQPYQPYQPYS